MLIPTSDGEKQTIHGTEKNGRNGMFKRREKNYSYYLYAAYTFNITITY